jgi:hypothetical protein
MDFLFGSLETVLGAWKSPMGVWSEKKRENNLVASEIVQFSILEKVLKSAPDPD